MPYKDKQEALAYYKKYNRRRTELVHQAKLAAGVPLDVRRKIAPQKAQ
ncbi:MAG: hypothetical protein ABSD42_06670 [Candidatus Bathyarchaeia archaeon]